MKKIPTLFERKFINNEVVEITDHITNGVEEVLKKGIATIKIDGSCCAIINGKFYKRYDAKKGKTPPVGAIPCQEKADEVTGHFPHWVEVKEEDPNSKWYLNALKNTPEELKDGTYEAIGPHFQRNPYGLSDDILEKHGVKVIKDCPRDFEGIKNYLKEHYIEGIVFWLNGEPKCKIKRSDFGFDWNKKQ